MSHFAGRVLRNSSNILAAVPKPTAGVMTSQLLLMQHQRSVIPGFLNLSIRMESTRKTGNASDILQGYKGRDHEFTIHRSFEVQAKAMEVSQAYRNRNETISDDSIMQDSLESSTDVCSHTYEEAEDCDKQRPLNLSSCMQSNVPEPYSAAQTGRSTYLNMPGGMASQTSKYFSSKRQSIQYQHKKPFSTSSMIFYVQGHQTGNVYTRVNNPQNIHKDVEAHAKQDQLFIQGIQGTDNDSRFKIWKENCIEYNLPNCDEQLQDVKSGRKTLSQIFEEQDHLIKETEEKLTNQSQPGTEQDSQHVTGKQKLQLAVKEYGSTVIVFHVVQSLAWLGLTYLAISR